MICDYGCGREAKYPPRKGMKGWCCSKNPQSCSEVLKINILKNNEKKHSVKTRNKMSKKIPWNKGTTGLQKAWNKGINLSKDHCKKLKESHLGQIPWNKGRKHSDETKEKISESLKGKSTWNKGRKHSDETKEKMSLAHKGKDPWNKGLTNIYSESTIKKMRDSTLGFKHTNETKEKMRISHKKPKNLLSVKYIHDNYPLFSKVEDISTNKNGYIQVHCKNHNCPNSKEQGGWFTPKHWQFYDRMQALEHLKGNGSHYFYCSEECKEECPLYGKTVNQLIKEDQIRAGYIEDPWYSSSEYQIWRKYIFELDDGLCVYCGQPATSAHHILPQKTHPNLSLDTENGISVCEKCHYKYGHRDPWCTTGKLSTLICERIIRIKEK